ncbi:hypothetical protein ACNUDN_11470 [Mycobacterium sp. smrl_JER01]|uniref:hypothetical protein n=1 Tax=Mycobacterium sp. smrl_JER01 TaxID=3402633 RepID=UPI003AD24A30
MLVSPAESNPREGPQWPDPVHSSAANAPVGAVSGGDDTADRWPRRGALHDTPIFTNSSRSELLQPGGEPCSEDAGMRSDRAAPDTN